jgi:hypothetical protein
LSDTYRATQAAKPPQIAAFRRHLAAFPRAPGESAKNRAHASKGCGKIAACKRIVAASDTSNDSERRAIFLDRVNLPIFVGRGFSHDINGTKAVRL